MVDNPKYIAIAPKPTPPYKLIKTNEEVYGCPECKMHFLDQDDYQRHKRRLHQDKKHPCIYCGKYFLRQYHLKRHINSMHSNNIKLSCPECNQLFNDRNELCEHLKTEHPDKDTFYCKECSLQCNTIDKFEKHQCVQLLALMHICSVCGKRFKSKDKVACHMKTIHEKHCIKCPICSKVFKQREHLAMHCRETHSSDFTGLTTQIVDEYGVIEVQAIRIINQEHIVLSDSD